MAKIHLTSISQQQFYQMRLFFGENVDRFLEIGNTFAKQNVEQLSVAVAWLCNVENVFSLRRRDTSDIVELVDKSHVRVDDVQQSNTIFRKRAPPSFVQRTNVTVLSSDICSSYYMIIELLLDSV